MPKLGDGQSLKTFRVSGWFGSPGKAGANIGAFEVKASSLQGAVGRGARLARKQVKGRFTEATITVETI